MHPYEDPNLSTQARLDDLLPRMTLEEKIGQLCMMAGNVDEEWLVEKHVGTMINVYEENSLRLQKKLGDGHRLRIPVLFSLDCPHGHGLLSSKGATVFPGPLALSCSWSEDHLETVGRVTATEMTYTGIHWSFAPVVDVVRDLRWGRVEETFGEDGFLVGEMAAAMIRGFQGKNLSDPESVMSCLKHFIGYSQTIGGRDSTETQLSQRQLRRDFLPPYERAFAEGCPTVMAGYQAIDGTPCSLNHWLLRHLLRDELGFEGFVVSDFNNIEKAVKLQKVCEDMETACVESFKAGNDMPMHTREFPEAVLKAVRNGTLSEEAIDISCARILKMKFALGLFDEKRYPDLAKRATHFGSEEHMEKALQVARDSTVLLKNENQTLPLSPKTRRVAVVGPNANDIFAQLGCWTYSWMKDSKPELRLENPIPAEVTILEAIRERGGDAVTVDHVQGCNIEDDELNEIEAAVKAAEDAEVVIAVVGDNRFFAGEQADRATLDLPGRQQELLKALKATGKPLVLVLVCAKPPSLHWASQHADAILCAWTPGTRGGVAIAEQLFGDHSPSGKLSLTFAESASQLPVNYNQTRGWHGPDHYIDLPPETKDPLYPFGFGLSYTQFSYTHPEVVNPTLDTDETLKVRVDITNTGNVACREIVQLYIEDKVASVVRPPYELKAYRQVFLQPGEKATVELEVPYKSLAILNSEMQWVVEPGEFIAHVGSSSRSSDLTPLPVEVR
ncbi:glycoside hydrolase family 3 N-terminal domain-containing protein [Puniceicoccus vermicola]|uniref:beta-glucosidase n=1 Tax=Puniceicoccus vermicola TaxID=388746 RepID=A0A7X1AV75_9BACT|nr:glycoside hydrolase family 3 N-terminal domain-containing protein [Puniceicoccus vermicola]MBC2600422.1 glycoside hydrolase family 3 C-terminal domain-containing protein [Puniceicoccus vermicola]